MKFITFPILILIFLNLLNYTQSIENKIFLDILENDTAISLLKNVYNIKIDNSIDICKFRGFFKCGQYDPYQSNIYSINYINLPQNRIGVNHIIEEDLTVFTHLSILKLSGGIQLSTSFFDNIYKLNYLTDININNQSQPISNNTKLPESLDKVFFNYLSVKLGNGWFESNISELTIVRPQIGYGLPNKLNKTNERLLKLNLAITHYYPSLPIGMGQYLLNLTYLELDIFNDISLNQDYKNFTIPTFRKPFKKLDQFVVIFYNSREKYQIFNMVSSFLNLSSSLTKFQTFGLGFEISPNISLLDFSYLNPGFYFNIETCSLIEKCKNNCFKLPESSSLRTFGCSFNISLIDFKNISSIEVQYNNFLQQLPTNFNETKLKNLIIQDSTIFGSIPKSYCSVNSIKINYLKIDGEIPSCIQCLGGEKGGEMILPNQYLDFGYYVEPICKNFKVHEIFDKVFLVDTNGTNIYITGVDLGWDIKSNNNNVYFIIPNSKFVIEIPIGVGVNHSTTITFENTKITKTFYYNYKPPIISHYSLFTGDYGFDKLVIYGSGFDFTGNGNILSKDNSSITLYTDIKSGTISLSFWDLFSYQLPVEGQSYNLTISVGGQKSNITTFYYFRLITINNDTNIKLNNTGGFIQLNGTFSTFDRNLVSVKINDIPLKVVDVTYTTLLLIYPPITQININYNKTANYSGLNLIVNIGGHQYKTNIDYIYNPDASNETDIIFPRPPEIVIPIPRPPQIITPIPTPDNTSEPIPTPDNTSEPIPTPNNTSEPIPIPNNITTGGSTTNNNNYNTTTSFGTITEGKGITTITVDKVISSQTITGNGITPSTDINHEIVNGATSNGISQNRPTGFEISTFLLTTISFDNSENNQKQINKILN
ncbi:hypothetical protein ACTFIZ_001187 [Dictyostelium cf. discoideum]